ncbi:MULTISPECIES: hypothetical protein [Paraburkholderia]|uniref:hypothetical protein n=1 Tax=Paraburkholderia TaxID=1822464 RepID=UPI001656396E|nr:hypothetical protein [Paraburkholderia podalyriae]
MTENEFDGAIRAARAYCEMHNFGAYYWLQVFRSGQNGRRGRLGKGFERLSSKRRESIALLMENGPTPSPTTDSGGIERSAMQRICLA